MSLYSPLVTELIHALKCLDGVGPKTARRMAFSLLDKHRDRALHLASTLQHAMENLRPCERCRLWTESERCRICDNHNRQSSVLCIVENPADAIAIEETHAFEGYYFLLNGRLSPLDGIGPKELGLDQLFERLENEPITEAIIATSATVEGEATAYYIADHLQKSNIKCSRLAHGIPLGGELEYLDSGTLCRALQARIHLVDHA